MLGRPKSSRRMLADLELINPLDLHYCEAALQADGIERRKRSIVTGVSMKATHGT